MRDSELPENSSVSPSVAPPATHSGGPVSLEGIHGTVAVPHHQAGFWEQWRAFVGPAILVSVGYMDPGNWGPTCKAERTSSTRSCGWWPSPA